MPAPAASVPVAARVAEEMSGWPADAVVLIAGEQGIDRVAGSPVTGSQAASPGGSTAVIGPVVTRVPATDGVSVVRAFEVQDGSIVYQPENGAILRLTGDGAIATLVDAQPGLLLEDADMPGADPARLRLVYRELSDDPSAVFRLAVQSGVATTSALVPGGAGVSYERFVLWTDSAVGTTWVDETGVRGTAYVEFPSGMADRFSFDPWGTTILRMAFDPNDGASVALTLDGVSTAYDESPRSIDVPVSITEVDLRGSSMAVQRSDKVQYYDLEPFRMWTTPRAQESVSFASVSRLVHSPSFDNFLSVFSEGSPRTCVVGQYLAHATVTVADAGTVEMSPAQIADADPAVVDGFPALVLESADGSFLIRITSDVCVVYLVASGISRSELFVRLAEIDVGHAGFVDY